MKKFLSLCSMTVAFFFISMLLQAQGGRGAGTLPTMVNPTVDAVTPNANTDIPFDGGLSLIAIAGVAYAAKKGYEKRKKQKQA